MKWNNSCEIYNNDNNNINDRDIYHNIKNNGIDNNIIKYDKPFEKHGQVYCKWISISVSVTILI